MAQKPGIVLTHAEYANVREILTQSQKGDLLDALMNFGETGELYTGGDPLVGMAFNMFSAAIKRIAEKYVSRCQKNAENIRKRWEKENAGSDTGEYDRIPANTNGYKRGETETETVTETEAETVSRKKRFIPPTVDEVRAYCQERGNRIDAEQFVNYYEARGWELKPGQKMKSWQASVRTWESNQKGWDHELRGAGNGDRVAGQRDLYGL